MNKRLSRRENRRRAGTPEQVVACLTPRMLQRKDSLTVGDLLYEHRGKCKKDVASLSTHAKTITRR